MNTETIDHSTLARLVEAGAVRGAHVVGQAGGWGIVVRYGMLERSLAATRSREVRVFRKLETVASYLREIGLSSFEVNTSDHSDAPAGRRPDRSAALKRAHQAAAHDAWFRQQVQLGLAEADDPATRWVGQEQASKRWARKRADLLKRAGEVGA